MYGVTQDITHMKEVERELEQAKLKRQAVPKAFAGEIALVGLLSFHVIGLAMVFGTIAIVDLRLLGLASAHRPFTKVAEVLKWTWVAFGLTITTGLLMFITNATVYFQNVHFRWKMVLIALSGLNMLVFELTCGRNVQQCEHLV